MAQLPLRHVSGTTVIGIALGVSIAWMLSRALTALAFGVTIASPLVWGLAVGTIVAAALLAAWRPAISAMRTDPLVLLRDQ